MPSKFKSKPKKKSSNHNRHGLSRTIPLKIKYQVRKKFGFGCIVCGNGIIHYDHYDPEFKDAKKHEVKLNHGLLTGSGQPNLGDSFTSTDGVMIPSMLVILMSWIACIT